MNRAVTLSWKPRRIGSLYCSPACGGCCTWKAYLKAVSDGNKLATRLSRSGEWKARIWENLGWHYCCDHASGYLSVSQPSPLHWYASFGRGESLITSSGVGDTPERAIFNAIRDAKTYLPAMKRTVEIIELFSKGSV